jgi:hypothetical protein
VSHPIAQLLLFTNGHFFFNHKVVPGTQGTTWSSLGFRQPGTTITARQKLQPPTHQPNSGLAPPSIFPSSSTIPVSKTRKLPNYPAPHPRGEDPQRTLDSTDDDEDDDAVGDGLGDEDGEPDNEDEGDDYREEGADEAETRNTNPVDHFRTGCLSL